MVDAGRVAVHHGGTVRFGIFDWLDDSGGDLAEAYAHRLKLLELADRHPFHAYHLAEHHGTPLGLAASPNIILAAAAARTERIRLGALVNVLPLYDPVRLVEEICMLDHLSRGRVELGVGRGGSPAELALYDVDPDETRAIYREAFDLVLAGLRTGRFDHEGKYFTRRNVTTPLRPVQRPYPPIWYPTSFPDSIPWIAEQGLNTAFAFLMARTGADPREQHERYASIFAAHRDDPGRLNAHVVEPLHGNIRHVVVADDDEQARALATPALERFFASFNFIWLRDQGREYWPTDIPAFIEEGYALVGSPATVRRGVADVVARAGGNYFAGVFAFGGLPVKASLRSLELFATEVIPALAGA